MPRELLLTLLLIGTASAVHAESDPYWDGTLTRKEQVSGPVGAAAGPGRRERRRVQKFRYSTPEAAKRPSGVPAPSAKRRAIAGKSAPALPKHLRWGLAAAGASMMGLGLLLMPSLESPPAPPRRSFGGYIARDQERDPQYTDPRPPTLGPSPENSIPAEYITPPPPQAAPLAAPWWAITRHEQEAINRWDDSFEKELGIEPLDRWLDANADALPRVDVDLLKRKLSRDV